MSVTKRSSSPLLVPKWVMVVGEVVVVMVVLTAAVVVVVVVLHACTDLMQ
jgi:hypothetical protein